VFEEGLGNGETDGPCPDDSHRVRAVRNGNLRGN
jgi:hypothetical protein